MPNNNNKDYWFNYEVRPPLYVCVEYNTTVYLRTRKGKPIPPPGGKNGGTP